MNVRALKRTTGIFLKITAVVLFYLQIKLFLSLSIFKALYFTMAFAVIVSMMSDFANWLRKRKGGDKALLFGTHALSEMVKPEIRKHQRMIPVDRLRFLAI